MAFRKIQVWLAGGALLVASAVPFAPAVQAQRGRDGYYSGMHNSVRGGNYNQRYGRDDRRGRDHGGGGIGPGYGALIGGGGGAVLGAVFGGGMKGALIGGAAGAGLGALGGKLAQGDDHGHHRR